MARYEDTDLEQRLRADAKLINAEVSPQLRSRIGASIRAAGQVRSLPAEREARLPNWWVSGLTGLAAAALIIFLVNTNRENAAPVAPDAGDAVATTVTPEAGERLGSFPLNVRTADLTSPLEEELIHLQEDLEKVRESVERDLRSTL
jgi:hypothetical protein